MLIGAKRNFSPIKAWFEAFQHGKPSQYPLIVVGDAGVGKTTVVKHYATANGFDVISSEGGESRTASDLKRLFSDARMPTFFGQRRLSSLRMPTCWGRRNGRRLPSRLEARHSRWSLSRPACRLWRGIIAGVHWCITFRILRTATSQRISRGLLTIPTQPTWIGLHPTHPHGDRPNTFSEPRPLDSKTRLEIGSPADTDTMKSWRCSLEMVANHSHPIHSL